MTPEHARLRPKCGTAVAPHFIVSKDSAPMTSTYIGYEVVGNDVVGQPGVSAATLLCSPSSHSPAGLAATLARKVFGPVSASN